MPTDAYRTGGEYFHECLIGICEEASARDYDIMITDVTGNDYSGVDRLIRKNKIDGVILTRTMEHDRTDSKSGCNAVSCSSDRKCG